MSLILNDLAASKGRPRDATQQQLAKLREQLNQSLYLFSTAIMGFDLLEPGFHGELCRYIELWGSPTFRRIITQCPRGSFKSSIGTQANALWQVCRHPDQPVVIVNETEDKPARWLRGIRHVAESNELFHVVYRDLLPRGVAKDDKRSKAQGVSWNDTNLDFEGRKPVDPESSISGFGLGNALTGHHWPKMIFDDLISTKHQQSPAEMQRVKEWAMTHTKLMRPTDAGMAYVNCTPWTIDDVYVEFTSLYNYALYRRHALEGPNGEADLNGEPVLSFFDKASLLADAHKSRDAMATFYCTPAETPITMADWSTKPIALVQIGDMVVGLANVDTPRTDRVTVPVRVIDRGTHTAEVFEYELDDGEFVRCTEDHQWLKENGTGRFGKDGKKRSPYGPIFMGEGRHPATKLHRLHSSVPCPYPLEAQWLGGMYDGEGSVSATSPRGTGGFVSIAQSDKWSTVNERLTAYLTLLGFDWKNHRVDRPDLGNYVLNLYRINGGLAAKARFVQWCQPAKVEQITRTMWHGRSIASKPRVVGRRSLGVQTVHWLQTETGNYIAWGCVSKNSQMLCIPLPGGEQALHPSWLRWYEIEDDYLYIDPGSYVEGPGPQRIHLSKLRKAIFFDPAAAESAERKQHPSSRHGIVVVGIDCYNRKFILETVAMRDSPGRTIDRLFQLAENWSADMLYLEGVNAQVLWKHWIIEKQQPGQKWSGVRLGVKSVLPGKSDKNKRILDKAAEFEEGRVFLNRVGCGEFQREYLEWHPNAAHRDCLDAFAYSHHLLRPAKEEEFDAWESFQASMATEKDPVTGYIVPLLISLGSMMLGGMI